MKTSERQRVMVAGMIFVSGFPYARSICHLGLSYLPVVRQLHGRICEALLGWLWLTQTSRCRRRGERDGWMNAVQRYTGSLRLFNSICNSRRRLEDDIRHSSAFSGPLMARYADYQRTALAD
ncbi:hypothetical protein DL98DRAFT_155711 [Cadophora sp. DSE1049]|nr:hypothetical protein DL98DRAFT_155711 [Cadophora sp. DSE1049]